MAYKLVILTMISAAMIAFGQTSETVAENKVREDKVEVSSTNKLADEIGGKVSKAVDEALQEADLEGEVGKIQKVEIRREITGGIQCDPNDESCEPRLYKRRFERDSDHCPFGRPKGFFAAFFRILGMLAFFTMWIITLIIIGKGFSKIAKAIERKNKQ